MTFLHWQMNIFHDYKVHGLLCGKLKEPYHENQEKSKFSKLAPCCQNSFIYWKMVTIPNVRAHGRSEMVNLKGVHHKYQSRLKRSGKIVNFCPFSMQRFSMIPADCQAPLRVCYSHDMSRHPIERIEASSGQFLRNWAFCDPYFYYYCYNLLLCRYALETMSIARIMLWVTKRNISAHHLE